MNNAKPECARPAAGASRAAWVEWAAARFADAGVFFGHGTDNAQDEAALLMMKALDLSYPEFAANTIDRMDTAQQIPFQTLVQRRIDERRPAAYLVGEAWFAGSSFYVDERALVPRSPIAELIERRFEPWVSGASVGRLADIGTGSGCIAVACALAMPDVWVDAVDIDRDALAVAAINVERHAVQDRVRLIESDLFSALEGERYDIIVSNPPYVSSAAIAGLPPEYRHEPERGLVAGMDGLLYVGKILTQARRFLHEHGVLVVEVGEAQAAVEKRYPRTPFMWLEFEHGGSGVFLLTAAQLAAGN